MADLRNFLEMPYAELEEKNLEAKHERITRVNADKIREKRLRYLTDEKGIKAVTVAFSDLEGRLHMLDYDKKFLLNAYDNLTFDGSSIRGFSQQSESDLRLAIDWAAFYWLPADFFGPGKVLVFGDVLGRDGKPYEADARGQLKALTNSLYEQNGYTCSVANEIEGFLFKGKDAEQHYADTGKFEFMAAKGYYYSLPGDPLRYFIDTVAEIQRAMGFENEKDHPEVAPSQFEINYSHTEASAAADQVLLYKFICRQVAYKMDLTASFLPKPVTGINGSGMHTNMSVSKDGTNLFYEAEGQYGMSPMAHGFIDKILSNALDICLILNPSVNAYRRLDPHFEAPNQIKFSPIDRGSMIRIPVGNSKSARIEVRSVAPDSNPYLVYFALFKTGFDGVSKKLRRDAILPDNIYDAITHFESSKYAGDLLTPVVQSRYAALKQMQADRCPKALGTIIKPSEIQFHHEVTNQALWNVF